jgi:hypothetical protein
MNPDKQKLIEQHAYALWQAEGQPHGKHEEHWQRAILEIEAEERVAPGKNRSSRSGTPRATTPSKNGKKGRKHKGTGDVQLGTVLVT